MFVGEGPGADEDAQGIPFVGKAGQLLNNMIAAMGLKREEVYIANVVKCRPPGNRIPEPEEGNTCTPVPLPPDRRRPPPGHRRARRNRRHLPLGSASLSPDCAAASMPCAARKLIVTYHPAYLLRDPRQKKEAWADLQIAMRELGLKPPTKS